jgi:hypothetical protein
MNHSNNKGFEFEPGEVYRNILQSMHVLKVKDLDEPICNNDDIDLYKTITGIISVPDKILFLEKTTKISYIDSYFYDHLSFSFDIYTSFWKVLYKEKVYIVLVGKEELDYQFGDGITVKQMGHFVKVC